VLFGKRRAYQRKVAVAEFEAVVSGDIYVLKPKNESLLTELLPFLCLSERFFEHAVGTSAGSLSPRTNWSSLANFEFDLPPLDQQRRIAEILWAVDDGLEHFWNGEQSSMAMLQAFSNENFPSPTNDCESTGQDLFELGKCCTFQSGYPFKSAEFVESGDRLLRCSNVGVNSFNWNPLDTRFWPTERRDEVREFLLQAGDIVIAMDRPFVGNGFKIARLTQDDVPALLLQRVGRLIANPIALADYIWAFLHSQSFRSQLLRCQQGTDLPHISRFDIEQARLPVPDHAKQREVSDRFASLEDSIAMIKGHVTRLRAVKDALLNALMSGGG
jgi:type I restriction enzyme S subunit